MAQKALVAVIDEFEAAIAALATHAPADVRARLNKATGDLLEALSTAAQDQAGHAALSVFSKVAEITDEMQQVRDQYKEHAAETVHKEAMLIDLAVQGQAVQDQQAVQLGILSAAQTTTDHNLKEHIEQQKDVSKDAPEETS